jgi:hypothetical protein
MNARSSTRELHKDAGVSQPNGLLVDEIHVTGLREPGRVFIEFANIDMNLDVASARKLAAALLDQADRAELEAMGAK